ncbi:MAG: PqqD family peptide modification chaperone [Pseudomonadota bacterium]|nr:PqqD family peptide modification chaperone [Pseudomonadota bacterium]
MSAQTLGLQTVVAQRTDTVAADIAGEIVVMDVEQGKYFGLNDIGSDIWRRLENPMTVDALCAALVVDYDGDLETIRTDVIHLLTGMAERKLVEVKG